MCTGNINIILFLTNQQRVRDILYTCCYGKTYVLQHSSNCNLNHLIKMEEGRGRGHSQELINTMVCPKRQDMTYETCYKRVQQNIHSLLSKSLIEVDSLGVRMGTQN